MRLVPRTWWNRVAAALGLLLGLLVVALFLAAHFWASPASWAQPVVSAIILLILLTGVLLISWVTWVCPVLDAGDPDLRKLTEPRRYLRSLQHALWMPVLLCGLIGLPNLFTYERIGSPSRYVWSPPWRGLVILAAVALALAFLAAWLCAVARRRLIRLVAQRHLCFNCGYDLRGNPEAPCPECGWPAAGAAPATRMPPDGAA